MFYVLIWYAYLGSSLRNVWNFNFPVILFIDRQVLTSMFNGIVIICFSMLCFQIRYAYLRKFVTEYSEHHKYYFIWLFNRFQINRYLKLCNWQIIKSIHRFGFLNVRFDESCSHLLVRRGLCLPYLLKFYYWIFEMFSGYFV